MNLAAWSTERHGAVGEERTPDEPGRLHAARSRPGDPPPVEPEHLPAWLRGTKPWWCGEGWWRLSIARAHDPLVEMLRAFANRMRAGDDPAVVMGGTEPRDAAAAALEWLAAGVNPRHVEQWLAAGCWNPPVVAELEAAGIRPSAFLNADGSLIALEQPDGAPVDVEGEPPLAPYSFASYVMDRTVPVDLVDHVGRLLRCQATG